MALVARMRTIVEAPQEYGLAAHERITFSLLDLSALPPGVVIRLCLDDALVSYTSALYVCLMCLPYIAL